MHRRLFSLIIALFIGINIAYAQGLDWMPDPNLRKAVREEIGVPEGVPITEVDIAKVVRLNVASMDITDLTGLERFVNLQNIVADHNHIQDLRPLASLTNLGDLHLNYNNIQDLRPLAGLTNLTVLTLSYNIISDISPLAGLTNLIVLTLNHNNISDISPLAGLVNLKSLWLWSNQIKDVSPLASLVKLETLMLVSNQIEDISPLVALTGLRKLSVSNNQIEDISPLVTLTGLRELDVSNNWIVDLSPLRELTNIEILDTGENPGSDLPEECALPRPSVIPRIQDRTYPSVFGAWASITDPDHPPVLPMLPWHEEHSAIAYYDLYLCCAETLDLKFKDTNAGVHLIGDFQAAKARRDAILAFNPNAILLVPVRYYSAVRPDEYSEDWPLWLRDENGNRIISHLWNEAYVDFTLPEAQKWTIDQAKAIAACGLFDGIFFDHWGGRRKLHEIRTLEAEYVARDNILQGIRAVVDDDFLVMVNVGENKIPRWAEYVNGTFMETYPIFETPLEDLTRLDQRVPIGYTHADIFEIEQTLIWSETHFREPRINAVHGYGLVKEPGDSPGNRRWMRLFTTMSLTLSDGYVAFDNYTTGIWYDFWDADLGTPVSEKAQLYENRDGVYIREFTNGWAVYNRSGKAQEIQLPGKAKGVANGLTATAHTIPDLDGDIYLKDTPEVADLNTDGVVNILDLVLVANGFGNAEPDLNGDGVVNILDLVIVANAFVGN